MADSIITNPGSAASDLQVTNVEQAIAHANAMAIDESERAQELTAWNNVGGIDLDNTHAAIYGQSTGVREKCRWNDFLPLFNSDCETLRLKAQEIQEADETCATSYEG